MQRMLIGFETYSPIALKMKTRLTTSIVNQIDVTGDNFKHEINGCDLSIGSF